MSDASVQDVRRLIDAGNIAQARRAITQLSETLKETAEAAFLKGVCSFRERDFAASQADFEAALLRDPMHSEARYYLALTLERSGNVERAIAELRETLRRDPSFKQATAKLQQLAAEHVEGEEPSDTIPTEGGAYEILLADKSPLSIATLERIERIRTRGQTSTTGHLDLMAGAALAGFLASIAATFFLAYVIGPYRLVPPNICREGATQEQVDQECVEFHGLRKKVDFGLDLFVQRLPMVLAGPLGAIGYVYLKSKRTTYELKAGRIEVESGVFRPRTEATEIIRIRSTHVVRPFLGSRFGAASLVLRTNEPSRWNPQVDRRIVLRGIGNYGEVNTLRSEIDDLIVDLRRNKKLQGILVTGQ